jgi:diaminohydroxyphosphoribosylaminopyrimidine deaminase / 5-amino-6-(5-phosphoribosylamino)uracil reductase
MNDSDLRFMKQAVDLADQCRPIKESIPRVGAIIARGDDILCEGFRGSGAEGDDDHAEFRAINSVEKEERGKLAGATLYTTLEPCTPDVRTKREQCCSELIKQHKLQKVFVGILDPNQGVPGKQLSPLETTDRSE